MRKTVWNAMAFSCCCGQNSMTIWSRMNESNNYVNKNMKPNTIAIQDYLPLPCKRQALVHDRSGEATRMWTDRPALIHATIKALGLHLAASQTGTATDSSTPATALTDIRRGTSAHAAPVTLALLGNEKPPVLPPVSPSVLPSKESSPPAAWRVVRREAVQAVQAVPVVQPASWHDAVREDEARPCGQCVSSSHTGLTSLAEPSCQAGSERQLGPLNQAGPLNHIGPSSQLWPSQIARPFFQSGPESQLGPSSEAGPSSTASFPNESGPSSQIGFTEEAGLSSQLELSGKTGPSSQLGKHSGKQYNLAGKQYISAGHPERQAITSDEEADAGDGMYSPTYNSSAAESDEGDSIRQQDYGSMYESATHDDMDDPDDESSTAAGAVGPGCEASSSTFLRSKSTMMRHLACCHGGADGSTMMRHSAVTMAKNAGSSHHHEGLSRSGRGTPGMALAE
eukprot:gene1901-33314_t